MAADVRHCVLAKREEEENLRRVYVATRGALEGAGMLTHEL